jgi:hypothetical protein
MRGSEKLLLHRPIQIHHLSRIHLQGLRRIAQLTPPHQRAFRDPPPDKPQPLLLPSMERAPPDAINPEHVFAANAGFHAGKECNT